MTKKIQISRDSPDDSRTDVNTRVFPAFPQDRSEVRTATVNSGSPNGGRGADLAIFAGIWTHSLPSVALDLNLRVTCEHVTRRGLLVRDVLPADGNGHCRV